MSQEPGRHFSPRLKVGDRVRLRAGVSSYFHFRPGVIYVVDRIDDEGDPWVGNTCFGPQYCDLVGPATKEEKAIAKAEAYLAILKDHAAKKAQQAAERKAKAERAKALRGLSAAGKRVVAMLQAGSADDFGCQRDNFIKLVAAITGDKPDAIKRAVAH